MTGSSSVALGELEKIWTEMEGYLFQKLSFNIKQKIETFYVSLEITSSVSDSGLHRSFFHAFAIFNVNRNK